MPQPPPLADVDTSTTQNAADVSPMNQVTNIHGQTMDMERITLADIQMARGLPEQDQNKGVERKALRRKLREIAVMGRNKVWLVTVSVRKVIAVIFSSV